MMEGRDTADGLTTLSPNLKGVFLAAFYNPFSFYDLFSENRRLTEGDPTEQALATIASILDLPASPREADQAATEATQVTSGRAEVEGYSKTGPGPIEAIRFKWSVRHAGNGQYFVDETVGDHSRSISSGPMSADAAVRFVDDQASEARQRFEALRNEMAGRAAAADILRNGGGGA
jgi:hypothetical protein